MAENKDYSENETFEGDFEDFEDDSSMSEFDLELLPNGEFRNAPDIDLLLKSAFTNIQHQMSESEDYKEDAKVLQENIPQRRHQGP